MENENGVVMQDYAAVLESGLGRPTVELELRIDPAGEYPWLETFLEPMKELVRKTRAYCDGADPRELWGKDALRDWMLGQPAVSIRESSPGGMDEPLIIWADRQSDPLHLKSFGTPGQPADDETFRLAAGWLAGELGVELPWAEVTHE